MPTTNLQAALNCPIPLQNYPQVLLAHGGGGQLMRQLIEEMFVTAFQPEPAWQHDAASLALKGDRLAFTTDSYVVTPLFFPGGDIGSLSVYGTVNDLAMAGARPHYLSLGFILEEGFPMTTLWQVVKSIQAAAERSQVRIVTGDTKVVDRGKCDGLFINTSGIGVLEPSYSIAPSAVQPGDVVILSGDIGRHGIAILSARAGLHFETTIESDTAPLVNEVMELVHQVSVHCFRDLTRGGLTSAINEIALDAKVHIQLETNRIPVHEEVQGACELLGLDPMAVANEGRFVAFVPDSEAVCALACLRQYHPSAQIIGKVLDAQVAQVILKGAAGQQRILNLPSGEQLPRIC